MDILIKIPKETADKLLRITKADSMQDAVNQILEKYVRSR